MNRTPIKADKSKEDNSTDSRNFLSDDFHIVGIGTSAGGLEAMKSLLNHLSPKTGMAFILVQHLSPDHKSMLVELLSKATKMKVREIIEGESIEADTLYIIPFNKQVEVFKDRFKLKPRTKNRSVNSIDTLFSSLAHAHGARTIGVILSGSGYDGADGLQTIKDEGGITFAQDKTAKFTGMPNAAIATGAVDYILSAENIAQKLVEISRSSRIEPQSSDVSKIDKIDHNDPALKDILQHLHKIIGVDYSGYKMTTIKRRIVRRMSMHKVKSLKKYVSLLKQKNEEVEMLHHDLLINVTNFFREEATYKYLKSTLFPKLLKRLKTQSQLRIWVPACATGQEAYSIAIILHELLDKNALIFAVQIFATDLNKRAINKARMGLFTPQELETVSQKRIQQFFTKTNEGFRINREVREMCSFAVHNILTDPPFSRLDFISCCNLFIYLDTMAQKRALSSIHYALNTNGFIMLGKSETIGAAPQLFVSSNEKHKIYSRNNDLESHVLPNLPQKLASPILTESHRFYRNDNIMTKKNMNSESKNLEGIIDAVLIADFMPASVAINEQMEIVQFRGPTDLYLTHPKGKASFNILKMARPEIVIELRNAILSAFKNKERVFKSGIEMINGSAKKTISIEVVPLKINWKEPLLLIIFKEKGQTEQMHDPIHSKGDKLNSKDLKIKKLEEELAIAYAYNLTLAEEQNNYLEELQSANEEIITNNEELQTVNEELQTSKEEIDSANEELVTTNQELQARNEQLNESYAFSEAVSAAIYDSMVVLDQNLRVKSANRSFCDRFSVNEDNIIGVSFFELSDNQWNIPGLRQLLEEVFSKESQFNDFEINQSFQNVGERILLLTAKKIVQRSKNDELILLAIHDITDLRKKSVALREKENELLAAQIDAKAKIEAYKSADAYLRSIFMDVPSGICILQGPDHKISMANDIFLEMIGDRNIVGKAIREALPEIEGQGYFEILDEVYKTGKTYVFKETLVKVDKGNGILEDGYYNAVYQTTFDENKNINGILAHVIDVTEDILLREELRKSEARYKELLFGLPVAVYTCNAEGYIELYNDAAKELWGSEPRVGKDLWCGSWTIFRPDGTPLAYDDCPMALSLKEGRSISFEINIERPDGTRRNIIPNPQPTYDLDGKVNGAINTLIDITPQVEALKGIEESQKLFSALANSIQNLAWMANADGWIFWYNQRWYDYTGTNLEDMEGWGWQSVHDSQKLPEVLEKWKRAIEQGEPFEMIFPLKGADKKFRSFLTRAFPIYDQEGNVIRWFGTNTDIHDQKVHSDTLEINLRESNERVRHILEHAPDAVVSINEEGEIISWNPEAEHIFGWKKNEVIGKNLTETIIPERYRVRHKQGMEHYLKTGDGPILNKPIEVFAVKKNHEEFPIELKISATNINDTEIFIGFIRDITVRRQFEENIKKKTNQLMEAQKLAHIGSWEWDVLANKIEWSDELYRIYGLNPQEFVADYDNYLKCVHEADRKEVNDIVQKAFEDQKPFHFVHRIILPDGTLRILDSSGKVFVNEKGETVKMSGTAQDVTEQKKYEAELEESKARFIKIFDNNPIPMSLSEIKTNKIKYVNNHFCEAFGYEKEEIIGNTAEEIPLIHPDEYERIVDHILKNLNEDLSLKEIQAMSVEETELLLLKIKQSEAMNGFEIQYTRKNGEKLPVFVSYELIRLNSDRYILTTYLDITERKKAEEQLKNQNEQLEKVNQELNSFTYVSSHDLQEPLRKIQTFAGRIMEKELSNLSNSGKDYFVRIQNAAERMQTLIQDLLAYSQMNTWEGKYELTNLKELFEGVVSEFNETIQEKNAKIDIGNLGKLNIIPFQFRQLAHNLISNALKYSSPNISPHIKIDSTLVKGKHLEREKLNPGKNYCLITFEDNGIGFEKEFNEKIFEVFQRLHGKNEYSGTGIGLSIVKKIVENHHGYIFANSELSKGTTFSIYIPV
ncbi:PAS domain S-box protein [Arenibacter sp. BSSL-BM3]|uniref:PAS domain S-box protein n=1 Tax=Arenibacter arenosicollis TaxID=2762274 RepID=A0ABR7QUC0_9FLAO|nr:PAS domain S-box protein [Arenibacter arenosicollis]MBC8770580.1 PAS domain S-box protein [Arenibacter arenosicollis]